MPCAFLNSSMFYLMRAIRESLSVKPSTIGRRHIDMKQAGYNLTDNSQVVAFPHLAEVLNAYGNAVAELYKRNLIQSDALATEALLNSVAFHFYAGASWYEVTLTLRDYWRFVEFGTKPHFPPVAKLREWVRVKPIIPKPNKLGKIPTENQLAYLIGRKISEVGTRGRHDLTNAVQDVNRQYARKLEDAMTEDLQDMATGLLSYYFK